MPRTSTFPTLYDCCKSFDIAFLKAHGYLKPDGFKAGIINWTNAGRPTGSISILVDMGNTHPFLMLQYKLNGKEIEYKIYLVALASNLGFGTVWYFRCPYTNKLCRKLYMVGGYFAHREAFKGCYYDIQIESHKMRGMRHIYGELLRDQIYEQRFQKYFKPSYRGKPTRRLQSLQKKLNKTYRRQSDAESLL